MPQYRAEVPPDVADLVRHLPPQLKRAIRAALHALTSDPRAGEQLKDELAGYWKYRVRRYRIVYRVDGRTRTLRVMAVGHRRNVYEEVAGLLGGKADP